MTRRMPLVELAVFLSLIVPSMVLSFFAIRQGLIGFVPTVVATIFRDLSLTGLILFFLWRNGEAISRIGWTLARARQDLLLGIALFVPFFLVAGGVENLLRIAGLPAPATPLPAALSARGPGELLLAIVLVFVVAIAEETIFRGYLLLRLQALTARPWLAVALSTVIFALGHGYEGTAGVVTVAVMGCVFALIYLRRRSIVAPAAIHFLLDFVGIVVFPLLRGR
jgi:membrane protease YdiL (CAAX protease family)